MFSLCSVRSNLQVGKVSFWSSNRTNHKFWMDCIIVQWNSVDIFLFVCRSAKRVWNLLLWFSALQIYHVNVVPFSAGRTLCCEICFNFENSENISWSLSYLKTWRRAVLEQCSICRMLCSPNINNPIECCTDPRSELSLVCDGGDQTQHIFEKPKNIPDLGHF